MQKKDYEMLMDVIEYIRNHPEKEQELLEEIKKIWQKSIGTSWKLRFQHS